MSETPSLNMVSQPSEQLPAAVGDSSEQAAFVVDVNLAERLPSGDAVTQYRYFAKLRRQIEQVADHTRREQLLTTFNQLVQAETGQSFEQLWPLETLTKEVIRQQYDLQMKLYQERGILHPHDTELAFTDYQNQERRAPSPQEVLALVAEQSPELRAKVKQGFTRLVLIPTGARIGTRTQDAAGSFIYTGLLGAYAQLLRDKASRGELFYSDTDDQGKKIPIPADAFSSNEPLYVWDKLLDGDVNKTIAYGPNAFDANQESKTLTKENYLKDAKFPGWQVLLIESDWNAPANDVTPPPQVGNRIRLNGRGSGQIAIDDPDTPNQTTPSIREWLAFYQTKGKDPASPYFKEQPLGTLEAYLAVALIRLQETGQVMGDWKGSDKFIWLLQQLADGYVPYGIWDRGDRQAGLGRSGPGVRDGNAVGLSSVSIG